MQSCGAVIGYFYNRGLRCLQDDTGTNSTNVHIIRVQVKQVSRRARWDVLPLLLFASRILNVRHKSVIVADRPNWLSVIPLPKNLLIMYEEQEKLFHYKYEPLLACLIYSVLMYFVCWRVKCMDDSHLILLSSLIFEQDCSWLTENRSTWLDLKWQSWLL